MSVQAQRPRQVLPLDAPRSEIVLPAPPALARGSGSATTQLLFMLPMMLGMGAMSFVYIGRSGGAMTFIFGGMFLVVMVGMLVMTLSRGGASKKAQINDERRDYLRYLGGLRNQVRQVAQQQRAATAAALPDPAYLWAFAGTARMWERRPTDADFARVRIGLGPQRLATALRAPQTAPLEDLDPVASTSLRHFIRTYATVAELPVAVSLRAFNRVVIGGEPIAVRDLTRAMVAHLATFNSPADLRIAVCAGPRRRPHWEWLKWLPHAGHAGRADAAGPVRLYAENLAALGDLLAAELGNRAPFQRGRGGSAHPHLVVILDTDRPPGVDGNGRPAPPGPGWELSGVTLIDLTGTGDGSTVGALNLVVADGRLGVAGSGGTTLIGTGDRLDPASAEVVARRLTAHHSWAPARTSAPALGPLGLTGLLGIGDPRGLDPAVTWQPRQPRNRLRIPIGVDPDGRMVELDLKESAEGGMGPHGLVIGATGSGKSELLRTLVTGLAVTHSSETLNFALIDFKGGATFAGMTGLPHTCAVITNLAAELSLVDRMGDALRGEMVRRQELLRAAGNFASVRDYERARSTGADLRPIPSLLVIIDEFSELLSSRPEFIDLFVMIGRLGRSLAIHLLLASQRLDEGRLRGLDSHLSYRVGLRTFSASESRAVLGVPDAYELPPEPGGGYLKIDTTTLLRFKAAYVSGKLPTARGGGPAPASLRQFPAVFSLAAAPHPAAAALPPDAAQPPPGRSPAPAPSPAVMTAPAVPAGPAGQAVGAVQPGQAGPAAGSVMDTLLGRLDGYGPPARQIWLPPLAEPATLDQILPPLADTAERGRCPAGWTGNGRLAVPVAIVDKPFEQRRDLLWTDLSAAAGHAVVVGAPQSGKTTLLRSLVGALALTHTPREVQFFLLDFAGGALSTLADLPHVSGFATRLDAQRCRRVVAELTTLLAEREELFQRLHIDSAAVFRRDPPPAPDGRQFGDVFLVVDGWMALRQEFEHLEEGISNLAARGLGFGIHVVLSINRWMELRPAMRDMIGTQFELRLGDPGDSAIDRRAAANVPATAPGRGLTRDKLQFLTALPRVDGEQRADDLAAGIADLVAQVNAGWTGARAPQVRLLPPVVPVDSLPSAVRGRRQVPIGIAEADLGPVWVDFDADPHLVAFGDTEAGKTNLLRVLARGIVDRYPPAAAAIIVVDYRRGLLDAVSGEHLLGYAGSAPSLAALMPEVVEGMRARLPGPAVTAEQLRHRSWWSGPELFFLVDDYDLVAAQGGNPLLPLVELLPQARDIGLHLVLTRRTGGAGRALYEPVIQRLRELSAPGLVLSGAREEGALVGDVKPSLRPPGQGQLVSRRGGAAVVQVAWLPPDDGTAGHADPDDPPAAHPDGTGGSDGTAVSDGAAGPRGSAEEG